MDHDVLESMMRFLDDAIERHRIYIASGACPDHSSYAMLCGEVKAYEQMQDFCNELEQKYIEQ